MCQYEQMFHSQMWYDDLQCMSGNLYLFPEFTESYKIDKYLNEVINVRHK